MYELIAQRIWDGVAPRNSSYEQMSSSMKLLAEVCGSSPDIYQRVIAIEGFKAKAWLALEKMSYQNPGLYVALGYDEDFLSAKPICDLNPYHNQRKGQ